MPQVVRIPTPSVAFPTLHVSSRDAKTLEIVSDAHVLDTLEHYQEFIRDHKECVDRKLWRKVRSRHGVRAYRERHKAAARRERFEKSGSSVKTRESTDCDVTPLMMLVGTLAGNLDDVLYGLQSPTTETMQLQSSYLQDGISDWAVLAPILEPTRADPFRELSLKWAVKRHSTLLGAFVRPRDLVYMESIGFTTTRSGERIGYQVKHSVDLAGTQELRTHNIVRAHLSFCYIYRQRSENVVDVFMRGTISPLRASALSNVASCSIATDIALSVARVAYCAQMKKLSWLLKTGGKQVPSRLSHHVSNTSNSTLCTVCADCVSSVTTPHQALKKTCRLCCDRVCKRCRVTKHVGCVTALDDQDVVVATRMTFCTRCIHRAFLVNAQCVAVHDVLESSTSTSSGGSSAASDRHERDVLRKLRVNSISTCSLDDSFFSQTNSSMVANC